MFADDLCTLSAGTNLAETCRLVQQDIDAVVKWSHDNGIILNSEKTKLLIINSPYLPVTETPPPLLSHSFDCFHNNLNNCICKPIEKVDCVTYLGVKVDKHFSWSYHIDYLCTKLRILLGKFYHLSFKVPKNTLKCLYFALVDSILDYALDSYGLTFKSYIDKLEILQLRFLKLLVNNKTKNKCKGDYSKLFKICKILPVSVKHKYLLLLNSHGGQGRDLQLKNHNYSTRAQYKGKYEVPRVVNYYGDRSLKKRLPYLLNTLPEDLRKEPSKVKFGRYLKRFFLENL